MNKFIALALVLSCTSVFAADELSLMGGLVKKRNSDEYIGMQCETRDCYHFNFYKLNMIDGKSTVTTKLNHNPLSYEQLHQVSKVMNLRCRVPGEAEDAKISVECDVALPEVLPAETVADLSLAVKETLDQWLGLDRVEPKTDSKVIKGLAETATVVVDQVSGVVASAAVVVSYPIRLINEAPRKNAPRGAAAILVMTGPKNRMIRLSSDNFERLINYIKLY